jgi:hypothetical protein
MWDLVNVEAIRLKSCSKASTGRESHKEYLDAIQKRGIGINVASLAALTPLRHYVMGEESFERAAMLKRSYACNSSCVTRWAPGRLWLYQYDSQ